MSVERKPPPKNRSNLPPSVVKRIEDGKRAIAGFYDEEGRLKSPEGIEEARRNPPPDPGFPASVSGPGDPGIEPKDEPPPIPLPGPSGPNEPQPPGQPPAPPTDPEPPSSAAKAGDDDPNSDTWQQRYRSLQGKYNQSESNLSLMQQQLDQMNERIGQLSQLSPPKPAGEDPVELPAITQDEVNEFGSDLMPIISRQAYHSLKPYLDRMQAQIDDLKGGVNMVTGAVVNTRKESMEDRLDQRMPDWRDVYKSREFKFWQLGADAMSGVQRKLLLDKAVDDNAIERVLTIFRAYKDQAGQQGRDTGGTTPRGGDTPATNGTAAPNGTGGSPRLSLETLAQPGRVRSAPMHTAADPKDLVTRAELAAFRDDVARGKYRGKSELHKQWQEYFDTAVAEHRII